MASVAPSSKTLPRTPSLERTTKWKISKETRGCKAALSVLWEHTWTVCFTNPSIFEMQLQLWCLLDSDILGNFQHFCPLAPFTKRGHLISGLLLSHRLAELRKNFHLTPLLLKKKYLCYQKGNLPLTNAHTTDSDSNVAMLQWGFIRSASHHKATEKLKHFWNASLEQCQGGKKITSKDFAQHSQKSNAREHPSALQFIHREQREAGPLWKH